MKRLLTCLLALGGVCGASGADSIVVFNEVQYHPVANEAASEWVELHNQMAIDIDLSAWSITGGVAFTFAEGTIIPGGGYLVVASDPAALKSVAGVTNVAGPFSGRLNNAGDRLRLRDRNDRLMDELEYRDGGKWPAAPDGTGATLAKRDPNLPSGSPENWTSSVLVGGTPGNRNFPGAAASTLRTLIPLDAAWRYDASGADLGTAWRAPQFDDRAWEGRGGTANLLAYWPFDGDATAVRGESGALVNDVAAAPDRKGMANGALGFKGSASEQYVNIPGGGGLNGAAAGTISLWVKWTGAQDQDCCGTYGAVLARQSNGEFSDSILALSTGNPATARVVWRQSGTPADRLLTGTNAVGTNWHHILITFATNGSTLYVDGVVQAQATGAGLHDNPAVPLSIGAWAEDGTGFATAFIDDVAVWDRPLPADQIAQLAAGSATPLDFAEPQNAVYFAGDGRLAAEDNLRHAALPSGPVTYYFRNTFLFDDNPTYTQLTFDLAVNDGAVVYLNGSEVYRHNLPAGPVTSSTLASAGTVPTPLITGLSIPASKLVGGVNVLAVEVHQAATNDSGMIFGARLTSFTSPPGPEAFSPGNLVFNELNAAPATSFRVELINRGVEPVDLAGYVVLRTGASADAEITLAAQTLAPGSLVALDLAALGLGVAPGDKLFLFLPGKQGVADAVEVHERPRGRSPDGIGDWLTPAEATWGGSNRFRFHDEVVINEIMYHAPPTMETPAVIDTYRFVTLTNQWRYEPSGTDLGTAWRAPGYDDRAWLNGLGLFYATTSNLPALKSTPLELGPTTYYFRTTFNYTGMTNLVALELSHVVDDGAVFYLNGREVARYNLPATTIGYATTASTAVGNAILRPPVTIALTNLVLGNNVLAVEVHQAVNPGNDVVFGAELAVKYEAVPKIPFSESKEQWVELFNRGTNAVNLAGWRLDEGIDYRFPSGAGMAPGGYLVIAKDPAALLEKFPGITVLGPYTNSLSHRGERLVLRDDADNPADVVAYFDGGRWPGAADADGASLELRDPRADNRVGEAWAASDEQSRLSWRTYSYRGTAAASAVGPDSQWKEFVLGMLASGEVLLDDISVIETPDTTPVQLIQNGTFDAGTNKWRIIGNHIGEVIDDPDQPGNKVLHLTATGGTEHMSNHAETTLANNKSVVNGREYQISFRAKWLRGSRQLNTRLYFNRLARTTILEAPTLYGTPGARNSTFATNVGPTFYEFRHDPPVPPPSTPVTVSVRAADPDGVASLTVWWSLDGKTWESAPMNPVPQGSEPELEAGYGVNAAVQRYAATLPGRAASTIVQFYVEAADPRGAHSMFPAAGPNSRALYKVNDGRAATNGLHNLRLIVRTDDANRMHNNLNVMSNAKTGCTMIYDEREVFYNVSMRLKGSEHSRTENLRLGFNVNLPSDHLFRGIHPELGIDRSESVGFGQREMLVHQTFNHCGGVPTKYYDLIQVMTPLATHTGAAELQLARYSDIFLDDQYERGSEGTAFEYELVYQLNSTSTGNPEGPKVPAPDSVIGTPITNLGDDKEAYRWNMLIKNNEDQDDYSRIIAFGKVMGLTGAAFNSQITNIIDVDQWLRAMAATVTSGAGDNYGGDGSQHNAQFYVRPADGRVLYFPHDVDAFLEATRAIVPNGDVTKILSVPAYARAYYGHLLDLVTTTYNGNYLGRWANHFGRLLPAQPFNSHLAFVVQRASFIMSQINSAISTNTAFAVTNNAGNNFGTASNLITLGGTASLKVHEITVNGVSYPLNWVSRTAWTLRLPLANGLNQLTVQGWDRYGRPLTNAVDTIAITNSGAGVLLPVVINEWMADNASPSGLADPADGLFQDWFELYNPNTTSVNLAGYYLTDNLQEPAKWQIPAGTVIEPRGFLLVWADNQPQQNGTNGHLHAGFQLNNDGEALALFSPGQVAQHVVVFGRQFQNVSQGLFPDGVTNAVFAMTNWTPRATNTLDQAPPILLRFSGISITDQHLVMTWPAQPGKTYRLEAKETLTAPAWVPVGDVLATEPSASFATTVPSGPSRFYRVVRLE